MIKLILWTAPENELLDGQWWDTQETLDARHELRGKVTAWNMSPHSADYPEIQIYRQFKEGENMEAYMMFESEEEAAMFKLKYL